KTIQGKNAFILYDTYGFPLELTQEYAEEQGYQVDIKGFSEEMAMQKERARKARNDVSSLASQNMDFLNFKAPSVFVGYNQLSTSSRVIKVFDEGLVLDQTPFYATSGGQVADTGTIKSNDTVLHVTDVNKLPNGQFIHKTEEKIPNGFEGETVQARVNRKHRAFTEYHHSATHLLFKALRDRLGNHVSQQGSQVTSENLRFDFNHFDHLSESEILDIEKDVNDMIQDSYTTNTSILTVDEAKEKGAVAEFGEKYADKVRTVDLKYTLDLCGGTHVHDIADIERFAIKAVYSIGSGIYRIEALANDRVDDITSTLSGINEDLENLKQKAKRLLENAKKDNIHLQLNVNDDYHPKGSYQDVLHQRDLLKKYQSKVKLLEKKYTQVKEKKALQKVSDFSDATYGNKIIAKVEDVNASVLKQLVDDLIGTLEQGFVLLATVSNAKVIFVAKNNDPKLDAGKIVREAAKVCQGSGGGRKDFAQAGGKDVGKIDDAIEKVKAMIL
ncbi:MAG TPA: alanine--tRNA ligase-related protein, partial [Candidatus Izemoplasmatales bacterium]|nr:alanine--tRNA ligase-related protein [Candidatus Izemoplasmatales bacterium]